MSAILERYSRAIRSSHLEMTVEPGDVDVLIAAGLVPDSIGTDLIRLRSERDSISRMPGERLAFRMLKSMARTRERLTRYAAQESGYAETDVVLIAVIAQVIDLFLDPNCPPCHGRGTVDAPGSLGGRSSLQHICTECRGSTKRRVMWPDDEARDMAGWLQAQMESKIDGALRKMNRMLRQN